MIIAFAISLCIGLSLLAIIDAISFRLPNVLTLPLIPIGLGQAYLFGFFTDAIIGALAGYVFFVGVETAYRHWRGREGLGRGDAKLLAVGGAWCGWNALPFIILIASGSALIAAILPAWRDKINAGRLPFGPFLSLGIFTVWAALQLAAG